VLIVTVLRPPVFATPGGLLLARVVLWSTGILLIAIPLAARRSGFAHKLLRLGADLGPMIVAVVGYVSLKLLGAVHITQWLGIPAKDSWMMAADRALFGKTPCLWFVDRGLQPTAFLSTMSWFYALYPFMPLLGLVWFIYKRDREQFRLVRRTLLISFYLGYCCYLLVPVSGPLTMMPNAPVPYIETTAGYAFLANNFRYPFDCFPSLHTANPWLLVWISRRKLTGWLLTAAVLACCGITLSTIVLQVHYGIDVIAGLLWIFPVALLGRATLPVGYSSRYGLSCGSTR
jgi:hypothetical protein